jgi:hypothetical protein
MLPARCERVNEVSDFSPARKRQGAPPPIVFARVRERKKEKGLRRFLRTARVKRVWKRKEIKEIDEVEEVKDGWVVTGVR